MHDHKARTRRLALWFSLNLIIFVVCYLNYRLQLKHRFLYRTLNIGLCLSRAAAMVINFNLLLVWLPMCKYSLTRLACSANDSLRRQQERHQHRDPSKASKGWMVQMGSELPNCSGEAGRLEKRSWATEIKVSLRHATWQLQDWLYLVKINSINSFLIAVDHCTSLHTICASTITLASVIHTVAHLMNVINFSRNYDPLLSGLNMAEYKGQNPLHLLVSGITGTLMMIILLLMSLSSVNIIRNSSFDLFQILHRLSIIFVLLLFLHPSSHVLKEQSNVDRHHPELCYPEMQAAYRAADSAPANFTDSPSTGLRAAWTATDSAIAHRSATQTRHSSLDKRLALTNGQETSSDANSTHQDRPTSARVGQDDIISQQNGSQIAIQVNSPTTSRDLTNATAIKPTSNGNYKANVGNKPVTGKVSLIATSTKLLRPQRAVARQTWIDKETNSDIQISRRGESQLMRDPTPSTYPAKQDTYGHSNQFQSTSGRCLDPKPLFIAQSSICWYVLSVGLSCYLVDLLLRRLRRSKSTVQLLDARLDSEGNLIELILSSNHKRFTRWLPGQYVYLNCPQVATYEWHPFTISSMDNRICQFTLHIKTGGDWTRKLRERLEYLQDSSQLCPPEYQTQQSKSQSLAQFSQGDVANPIIKGTFGPRQGRSVVPDHSCYNELGQVQVQCTKLVFIQDESHWAELHSRPVAPDDLLDRRIYTTTDFHNNAESVATHQIDHQSGQINLYIDGPFHSPFERLLEQQVSVCIANGVGWTAFSSVFQCIIDNSHRVSCRDDWWTRWNNFAVRTGGNRSDPSQTVVRKEKLPRSKLHLMVIVTTIEQLKPFYQLAVSYFNTICDEFNIELTDPSNPVQDITAFITRSSPDDESLVEFCRRENLCIIAGGQTMRVNKRFNIFLGKPEFDEYLSAFTELYADRSKISVYCCGSYQVKRAVQEICQNLNASNVGRQKMVPSYSYHEENF